MSLRISTVAAFCLMTLAAGIAAAGHLPAPTGEVVLMVSGRIEQTNAPGVAAFDLDALKRFPVREIRTTTDWHEGVQHFEGVSAAAVLDALGASGREIYAIAADGYEIEIPLSAITAYDPIFALKMNGAGIEPSDRGPVWLIFPYDRIRDAEEREQYTAWSVWALQQIKVQD